MFLLILDKNAELSAYFVSDRIKFKQLLELGQLICSTKISDVFKPVKQGKDIQNWILRNTCFVYLYFHALHNWCKEHINLSLETETKLIAIEEDLDRYCRITNQKDFKIKTAIFRYVKEYAEFTEYESNSELPIDIAVNEYKKYIEWKEKKYYENRTNRH